MVETKIINGLKVVINHNRNLTIATLSDNSIEELKQFLINNSEAVVVITPRDYEQDGFTLDIDTFDILKQFDLKRIIITSGMITIKDISGLYAQKNLTYLDISFFTYFDIDFSYFKKLEKISFYWTPGMKNFFSCSTLKDIDIHKYKAPKKDLAEFSAFPGLQNLWVVQSNIVSIRGIEKLNLLNTLFFSHNTNLEISFSQLGFTMPHVEDLEIDTCRKIDLDFIKIFPNLKRLKLTQFQDIKSLRPILDGLPKLEELFVGETKIEESDNAYYANYSNIKRFFFDAKKHHRLKNEDLGKDW